jgi:hypothetical protein
MPNLIPVDYDPFMGAASAAPNLIPVDHDPFADTGAGGPSLIPVDHDPFDDDAAAAPSLVPVDHDPFATSAGFGDGSQSQVGSIANANDARLSKSITATPSYSGSKLYPATGIDFRRGAPNQNDGRTPAPMPSQGPDELTQNLSNFCKKIKELCIDRCIETSMPTGDYGFKFQNCVGDCMASFGCPSVRRP